ncbi:MAG: acyl-CoA dehydrogenase family protein [Chloroflexi bacterium]|nr:acyl-CoA dehydrogenase family protein [Chloroflexota bacterium]
MDFTIPKELQEIAKTVREFVDERLEPISYQVETEHKIPDEIIAEMAEIGLFGLPFSVDYGGVEAGELGYCLALEELGKTNAAYSNLIGASVSLCGTCISLHGNEEQKQKYLTRIAAGEAIGAFALTEPELGCDAQNVQTKAEKIGEKYVLNGSKRWITNGPIADVFVVIASTNKDRGARGQSAFIVEKGTPGFSIGHIDEKMGLHGSLTSELFFEDCEVPVENRLGREGTGFVQAMNTLDLARITLAAGAIGASQKLLERSIEYSKQRVQFGKPISQNQAIQWMIADMATEIYAARMMLYNVCWKVDQGKKVRTEAAMVKLFASELAGRVADAAVQIHGGLGYMQDIGIERFYRDARIMRIYEGTSEMQRLVISMDLLKG